MAGEEGQGGRVQYTTVTFPDAENHHAPPPARRNTTYTNIKHPRKQDKSEQPSSSAANQDAAGSEPPPSYMTVGGGGMTRPPPQDQESEEVTYDVPPPPVPVRFSSQDTGAHEQGPPPTSPSTLTTSSTNPVATGNPDTSKDHHHQPEDPFSSQSQFGDPFATTSAWSDPAAFYDKPRNMMNALTISDTQEDGGYLEIGKATTGGLGLCSTQQQHNSADFTGDSSYEDTSCFLQDIHARYKNKHPEDLAKVVDGNTHPVAISSSHSHPGAGAPPVDEEAQLGSYDFPAALNRYPFKEPGTEAGVGGYKGEESLTSGGGGKRREEPTLHTIQYPVQKGLSPSPQPLPSSAATGASVKRSESYSHTPRSNVPLPPLPRDESPKRGGVERSPPPPLPARQMGGGGGTKALVRDSPLPPLPSDDRPRLPPFNHPWGNKKQAPPPHESCNPPLPPRKKPQSNANGHPQGVADAGPPPPALGTHPVATPAAAAAPHEDPAMLDLMSKGYQRADIESALRIAKNDYELAKSILKEFRGRH